MPLETRGGGYSSIVKLPLTAKLGDLIWTEIKPLADIVITYSCQLTILINAKIQDG